MAWWRQLADNSSRAVVCADAANLGQALAWSGRRRDLEVAVVTAPFARKAWWPLVNATSVAAPVLDRHGMPVAAVTVFTDSTRLPRGATADVEMRTVGCARTIGDELAVPAGPAIE